MTPRTMHAGERAVQQRLGVHERMAEVMGQVVRDHMPEQHREFFAQLPTVLVGSLDAQGQPWASVLQGAPGFISSPDAQHLHIAGGPTPGDPWSPRVGTPIGLLGLEPHTRRRNRMNGSIVAADARGLTVQVDQSFGNCPKYIQARSPQAVDRGAPPAAMPEGPRLGDAALRLVQQADTLFIASATPDARAHAGASGVDVSHRGGPPGFVHADRVGGATVLTLPDYRGNQFFNTLGNLVEHPRAGLLFIDYDEGHLLHLAGQASVVWDGPQLQAFPGAQHLLRIVLQQGLWRPHALPLRWSAPVPAPQFSAPP